MCPQLRHRNPQNHSQLLGESGKTSATSNPPQRPHGLTSVPGRRGWGVVTSCIRAFGLRGMSRLIGFSPFRQG